MSWSQAEVGTGRELLGMLGDGVRRDREQNEGETLNVSSLPA